MQVTEPHNAAQPLEQVINSVRAAAEDWHLVPDDMIFLNGSRVEEFENQHSDVDIWLASKSDPQSITSIPRMGDQVRRSTPNPSESVVSAGPG